LRGLLGCFREMEAALKKLLAIALLAACGCPSGAPAATAEKIMLAPGVYTTADISRRCQRYTARRVSSTRADTERQSVFLACVQKLSGGAGGAVAEAAPPPPSFVAAPVALTAYAGWYGDTCSTDEGYGRRGSCDTF
jgi:hypothetical protein